MADPHLQPDTWQIGVGESFRRRLHTNVPLLGTFLGLGSALVAEACAMAGFDWLLIDLEHGPAGEDALSGQLLAAAAHRVPAFVRVETAAGPRISRALDLGATGVMFPRLDDAQQVAAALRFLRYPPEGDRGVATYTRACWFGMRPEALDRANSEVISIVQIESVSALDHVEQIATIGGVDVLFVGPRDLTHALGIPGQTHASEYTEALARVGEAARAAGIAAGVLASDQDSARRYASQGFTFIAVGSDSAFLANGARSAAAALQPQPVPTARDQSRAPLVSAAPEVSGDARRRRLSIDNRPSEARATREGLEP